MPVHRLLDVRLVPGHGAGPGHRHQPVCRWRLPAKVQRDLKPVPSFREVGVLPPEWPECSGQADETRPVALLHEPGQSRAQVGMFPLQRLQPNRGVRPFRLGSGALSEGEAPLGVALPYAPLPPLAASCSRPNSRIVSSMP